jgi:hypothetical protein
MGGFLFDLEVNELSSLITDISHIFEICSLIKLIAEIVKKAIRRVLVG